jgi:3-deoxy-D-manno-octulosonate 8-phosphate phosphatase KdsC-like HAD superfamily phosphatase
MRDGMGLNLEAASGRSNCNLTFENLDLAAARMKKLLNIAFGVKISLLFLTHFLQEENVNFGQVGYVGEM